MDMDEDEGSAAAPVLASETGQGQPERLPGIIIVIIIMIMIMRLLLQIYQNRSRWASSNLDMTAEHWMAWSMSFSAVECVVGMRMRIRPEPS